VRVCALRLSLKKARGRSTTPRSTERQGGHGASISPLAVVVKPDSWHHMCLF